MLARFAGALLLSALFACASAEQPADPLPPHDATTSPGDGGLTGAADAQPAADAMSTTGLDSSLDATAVADAESNDASPLPGDAAEDAGLSGDASPPEDAASEDAAVPDAAPARDGGTETWRTSLGVCWRDPSCNRALILSHGGDWNVSNPYNSRAAFERAFACGADGIETDIRVTQDGVPVLAHSSPIELYESVECAGRRIEQMTADEVTECNLAPSLTETFQRLDDVLQWARGKVIIELDVKEAGDLARTIEVTRALGAQDGSFVMVSTEEMALTIPTIPGWQELSYMVRMRSVADITAQAQTRIPQVFMLEMDRTYTGVAEQDITALISGVIHPAGLKAMASSDSRFATVNNHLEVFNQGFDVVLSYDCANGVSAARQINQQRGLP